MNNSNIFELLNKQYSLESTICLADSFNMSQSKIKELEKEGFSFGYTKEEWERDFPHIDPKYMLCCKSFLFPADLLYYDKEHYICFHSQLYGANRKVFQNVKESMLLSMRDELYDAYQEKNWKKLLQPTRSEGSGNIQLALVKEIAKHELPSSDIYDLFIDTYTMCDAGCSNLTEEDVMAIVRGKGPEAKAKTRKLMNDLPDPLTIYRGQGSKSTRIQDSLSWSLDPTTAYFFASWRGGEEATVWTAKVAKEKVIDYITDRNEEEILVRYSDVFDVSQKPCLSWDLFLSDFVEGTSLIWDDFTPEPFTFNAIMNKVSDIYGQYPSGMTDHNRDHSIRVAMLAAEIFREIYVNASCPELCNYSSFGWNDEDFLLFYKQIITAAMWHDVGRSNDGQDITHGAESWQRYLDAGNPDDAVIRFLVEYHCRPDWEADKYLKDLFSAYTHKNQQMTQLICLYQTALKILKDADALDRCRFGWRSPDFVKVPMLRTEEAKTLMPVAFLLCKSKLFSD